MKHILEVDSIWLEFGSKIILSDIYIKLETGKITGLLGRNGQGKTSLMKIVCGNLVPTNKSIRIDRIPISHAYKKPQLLRYLPQFNFIPNLLSLKRVFWDFNLEYSKFEVLFPEFKHKYKSLYKNLSMGQRRIVEVYIIIKSKSQFCMLDEPFSYLMPLHVEKISELLLEEKHEKGILVTDHMYKCITNICDTLFVLKDCSTFPVKEISDLEKLGYVML